MNWLVLRMAAPRTLCVVEALRAVGVEAWTPEGMQRRYRPRSTKYTDAKAALLPSFAFAPAGQLARLLAIIHTPGTGLPPFSIFQRGESFPTASDGSLQPLRDYEAAERAKWEGFVDKQAREAKQKRKKTSARAYVMGQRVRVDKPAFAGLDGKIVEIRKNGDLVLEFTGFLRGTTVPSCDVAPVRLVDEMPAQAQAA